MSRSDGLVTIKCVSIDKNGKSTSTLIETGPNVSVKSFFEKIHAKSHVYKGIKQVHRHGDPKTLIKDLISEGTTNSCCLINIGCQKIKKLPRWDRDHLEMKKEVQNQQGQLYFTVVINGYALKARVSMLSNSIICPTAARLCYLELRDNKYKNVEIQIDEYKMGGLTFSSGAFQRIGDDCDLTLGLDFLTAYNAKYNFKTGHLTVNDTFTVQAERDTFFKELLDYNNLTAEHVHSTSGFLRKVDLK